jgi:L-fucose mutarotase/ribose pyranase (RbsD/FucU family)
MTILKGVPRIVQPRLLYSLASMGHGDEIVSRPIQPCGRPTGFHVHDWCPITTGALQVFADANFPAAAIAANTPGGLVNADGR